jgi:DNA-binding transcriptional LysR family regulator
MPNSILSRKIAEVTLDLNDLRVFAYVASLASFSLAADALKIHKSSVSRSIARLETMLDAPLLQRTTRKIQLTRSGVALKVRCIEILTRVNESIAYIGSINADSPRRHGVLLGSEITLPGRTERLLPQFSNPQPPRRSIDQGLRLQEA